MTREEVWLIAYSAAHDACRLCGGDPGDTLVAPLGGSTVIEVVLARVERGEVASETHLRRIVWQAARHARHRRNRALAQEARIRAALAGA